MGIVLCLQLSSRLQHVGRRAFRVPDEGCWLGPACDSVMERETCRTPSSAPAHWVLGLCHLLFCCSMGFWENLTAALSDPSVSVASLPSTKLGPVPGLACTCPAHAALRNPPAQQLQPRLTTAGTHLKLCSTCCRCQKFPLELSHFPGGIFSSVSCLG
jgi:hypothetical protein